MSGTLPTRSALTVRELRDFLAAFDDDTPVLVSGYEDGYDFPAKLKLVTVYDQGAETKEESWWSGRYREPWTEEADDETTFTALVIPR